MIKANELRIGNNANLDWDGDFRQITIAGVVHDFFEIEGFDETFSYEYLSPVRLTQDILERCGFERYKYSQCYIKKYSNQGELCLFSTDTPVAIANNLEPNCFYYEFNHILHIVKFLHQLQNLYFALTGTELKVILLTHG